MSDVFSNGPRKDFVIKPFQSMIQLSTRAYLAAPYFTEAEDILAAAAAGKSIDLLVGLNEVTSPLALKLVFGVPNIAVRYLTRRFHAKIFIFDDEVLIGSSNLTKGGFFQNREATLRLYSHSDMQRIEDIRAIFAELWESAEALTDEALRIFAIAVAALPKSLSPDEKIENALGRVEPPNVSIESRKKSQRRIYEMALRREVYEQYRPAFLEVTQILEQEGLRRTRLKTWNAAIETNRFLNWVRLSYVHGDDAWQSAERKPAAQRRAEILVLGAEWKTTTDDRIPDDYFVWLRTVEQTFGTSEAIASASKEQITQGLVSLHAFAEQLRFTKGGLERLPKVFWDHNGQDVERVRQSLTYLTHGTGDFILRLHDLLYDQRYKLGLFGRFCALELYGTIKPSECPPMNGRMAKALRYLGFDVKGS
jgi:hypothetical protein